MTKPIDEKDEVCCQQEDCTGVESCDCQGICTCEAKEIDFDAAPDDCDSCCCEDDDDDDCDEFEEDCDL